jgi:hypothetical protein
MVRCCQSPYVFESVTCLKKKIELVEWKGFVVSFVPWIKGNEIKIATGESEIQHQYRRIGHF